MESTRSLTTPDPSLHLCILFGFATESDAADQADAGDSITEKNVQFCRKLPVGSQLVGSMSCLLTESAESILLCQKAEFKVIRQTYFGWIYHRMHY